jgi:hypothetical protein
MPSDCACKGQRCHPYAWNHQGRGEYHDHAPHIQNFTHFVLQLNSLCLRTGTETILFTTHGSTDLPLNGIVFTTEGVGEFMSSVMGIDHQDLVNKMEGFAIQGIKGIFLSLKCFSDDAFIFRKLRCSCKSPATAHTDLRGNLKPHQHKVM